MSWCSRRNTRGSSVIVSIFRFVAAVRVCYFSSAQMVLQQRYRTRCPTTAREHVVIRRSDQVFFCFCIRGLVDHRSRNQTCTEMKRWRCRASIARQRHVSCSCSTQKSFRRDALRMWSSHCAKSAKYPLVEVAKFHTKTAPWQLLLERLARKSATEFAFLSPSVSDLRDPGNVPWKVHGKLGSRSEDVSVRTCCHWTIEMREVLRLCKIPIEHPWSFFSGSSNIFVPPLFFWFRAAPFRHHSSSDNKGISGDTSYSCCCLVGVWSLQGVRVSLPWRRRFSYWMARLQKGRRPCTPKNGSVHFCGSDARARRLSWTTSRSHPTTWSSGLWLTRSTLGITRLPRKRKRRSEPSTGFSKGLRWTKRGLLKCQSRSCPSKTTIGSRRFWFSPVCRASSCCRRMSRGPSELACAGGQRARIPGGVRCWHVEEVVDPVLGGTNQCREVCRIFQSVLSASCGRHDSVHRGWNQGHQWWLSDFLTQACRQPQPQHLNEHTREKSKNRLKLQHSSAVSKDFRIRVETPVAGGGVGYHEAGEENIYQRRDCGSWQETHACWVWNRAITFRPSSDRQGVRSGLCAGEGCDAEEHCFYGSGRVRCWKFPWQGQRNDPCPDRSFWRRRSQLRCPREDGAIWNWRQMSKQTSTSRRVWNHWSQGWCCCSWLVKLESSGASTPSRWKNMRVFRRLQYLSSCHARSFFVILAHLFSLGSWPGPLWSGKRSRSKGFRSWDAGVGQSFFSSFWRGFPGALSWCGVVEAFCN